MVTRRIRLVFSDFIGGRRSYLHLSPGSWSTVITPEEFYLHFLPPLGIACLVLSFGQVPLAIHGFMFLLAISYGFSSAIFGTIWPETYGTAHLGAIRAVAVAAMVFASAIGPGITGWCIDRGIGFDFQLLVMAGYCLFAAATMVGAVKILEKRQQADPVKND